MTEQSIDPCKGQAPGRAGRTLACKRGPALGQPKLPEKGQGQQAPSSGASGHSFLSLPGLLCSSPSLPVRGPNCPHPPTPGCQVGKVGLIFRLLYCGLTLPHIKNSSHCLGRPLHFEKFSPNTLEWVYYFSPSHPETFM